VRTFRAARDVAIGDTIVIRSLDSTGAPVAALHRVTQTEAYRGTVRLFYGPRRTSQSYHEWQEVEIDTPDGAL
jgi:hypothetical protein